MTCLTGLMLALTSLSFAQEAVSDSEKVQLSNGQWSVGKANEWYAKQAWIVGCNFLPSTAVNAVEMWQNATFDLPAIDKELALAKAWGINSVRVFLNYVVWEAEVKTFKANFGKFLDVAEKYGISVMPVLFDDCNFSGNVAKVGQQPNPVPGIHNSGWVSSPPVTMVRDESQWKKLKKYEQDMIRTFGSDKRIIIWDLYNEPGNSNSKLKAKLLEAIFAWAREVKPTQPLTVGAHTDWDGELSKLMRNSSDIVSFHSYGDKKEVENKIQWAHSTGRPAVCTEWLRRQAGNTVHNILPLFKSDRIGCYHWGLVEGRTQTYFHWGSEKDSPKPDIWQHDLIRSDGTPYSLPEYQAFKNLTYTTDSLTKNRRWTKERVNQWYAAAGWFNGVNYIPSDAINYTAMWDKTSFNPELIDRELALAEDPGFNCVRVVLQHAVYAGDPAWFLKTLEQFLEICAKHKIRVMPCFFDDCAFGINTDPAVGKQPDPLTGWYAWAWSPSPGHTMVIDERYHPQLEKYVKEVMSKFRNDPRIFIWDLYNEPTNSGLGAYSLPLVRKVFAWAREINPVQPLTVGVFNDYKELNQFILDHSDVVSYHSYGTKEQMIQKIEELRHYGRPLLCSEWMNRPAKSTVEDIMPLLKEEKVGAILWGLVNGKTQTDLRWGHRPEHLPYTGVWQHDLFRNDFTPYRESELTLIKKLNGK
ncbi:MAG: cellulase family glycosylhydrolase [Tannerella sp.]|nr:cellulase family glycosylhydrolase [Tannerella sp.]